MANEAEKGFLSKVKSGVTKSAQWFKDKVKEYQKIAAKYSGPMARRAFIKGDKSSEILTGQPIVGRMYLFQYDAKFKDILPYWDVWPLIFPFDYAKNGFYGINLHYLPPAARHNLLVALWGNQDSTKNQLNTELKAYEDKTSNQLVVVTWPTLNNETLEDASMHIAKKWKIGKKSAIGLFCKATSK